MIWTLAQLRDLAAVTGFPDPSLAAAVAMAESGGDASIVGDGGTSFGLWQIHTPAHPEYASAPLFDAATNARAAFAISQRGADWSPWSTFTSGRYRAYLAAAPASVPALLGALVAGVAVAVWLRRL